MADQTPPVDSGWRRFPQFEKLFDSDGQNLMTRMEKTCRLLDEIIRNGSEADKDRARLAMNAYGRTLDLVQTLDEIRQKEAAGAQQGSPAGR